MIRDTELNQNGMVSPRLNMYWRRHNSIVSALCDLTCSSSKSSLKLPLQCLPGGVLYIRPSLVIFNAMKSILKNTKSYVSKDTGFLNEFFKDWHTLVPSTSRLPDGYNAQICQEFRDHWRTVEKKGELYVIHFIGQPKPWNSPLNESSPWLSQWRQKFAESSQHLLVKSQRKAPPPTKKVSSKDMHAQIHRRYKELRKQNMDPRQAMLQARFDCGDTNRNVDVGAQVANMFGLGNIM